MTVFTPGANCWKIAHADTFDLLVDGENYFRSVRSAMQNAKERIILIGWDFDARVKMFDTQGEVEGPLEVGEYLDWLVRQNSDLEIYILQWDVGALKLAKRGKTLLKVAAWLPHPRVHFALDGAHAVGAAQHEKLVVVDNHTAFCGGIDITEDRWDTREHRDYEEKRKQPGDHDAGPWHDASARLTGEVAHKLAELAEKRWHDATGEPAITLTAKAVAQSAAKSAPSTLRNVPVAIARTRGETDDHPPVREIEALYCDVIESVKTLLYIENQYFTSKRIARALAGRLREDDPPEIIMVLPATSDGWLESQMMDPSRARLIEALRQIDHANRFRAFHPLTENGTDIYVHAKVMIGDDRFLRIGSSNLSNRSMGTDSECDVCVDAAAAEDRVRVEAMIRAYRNDLLAEHLGKGVDEFGQLPASSKSLIQTIESASQSGRRLRRFEIPKLNALQEWLSTSDILDPETSQSDAT